MKKYFTVYAHGEQAEQAAAAVIGPRCYSHIEESGRTLAQIETVADGLVSISYIESAEDVREVLHKLARLGFAGCAYTVCDTVEDGCYAHDTEIERGTITAPAEEQTTENEEEKEVKPMKEYKIKPEFYDLWGAYEGNDTVTAEQITDLAREWEKPIDELMEQVEEQTTDTEEEEEEETMFTTYTEAVTADAAEYIRDNYTAEEIAEALTDRDEFAERLNDEMWIADQVTGNGSGSYTFDRMKAREYVLADIDTVREALTEFGTEAGTIAQKFLDEDWEYFDVTARCYVLGQAIAAALDSLEAPTLAPAAAACVW